MKIGMETPWGSAQTVDRIAPGLWLTGTARHGGYYLSPEMRRQMPPGLRGISTPYTPPGWYERDCDCCIAVIGLAQYFDGQACWNAVRMVRTYRSGYEPLELVRAWLESHKFNLAEEKARRFETTIDGKWERGSCSCGPGEPGWLVYLHNLKTDERKEVRFADYPGQQFYTDAEIQAAMAKPAAPDFADVEEKSTMPTAQRLTFDGEPSYSFDESDCGGAFDGCQVVSDADSGL